jgi:hypothetical protein
MELEEAHIAQVNIARMRGDLSDPVMATLVARVDEMNALAESSKGFIWRLRGEEITQMDLCVFETYVVPFQPSRIFYNMSVWNSIGDLQHFVAKTVHAEMLRDRHMWIDHFDRASLALWWIPAEHRPSVAESAARLRSLHENGPTPYAFTFSKTFAANPLAFRPRGDRLG